MKITENDNDIKKIITAQNEKEFSEALTVFIKHKKLIIDIGE